jgi:hypothetical protein
MKFLIDGKWTDGPLSRSVFPERGWFIPDASGIGSRGTAHRDFPSNRIATTCTYPTRAPFLSVRRLSGP